MSQAEQYLQLLAIAINLGTDLVDAIRSHARGALSPSDYTALETRWQEDVERSARNAGVADPT